MYILPPVTIIMATPATTTTGSSSAAHQQANTNPSSPSAAHEVLRLLAYALDMVSRHKEGLKVLLSCGDGGEEVEVVNRLGCELKGMWHEAMVGRDATSSSAEEERAKVALGMKVSLRFLAPKSRLGCY